MEAHCGHGGQAQRGTTLLHMELKQEHELGLRCRVHVWGERQRDATVSSKRGREGPQFHPRLATAERLRAESGAWRSETVRANGKHSACTRVRTEIERPRVCERREVEEAVACLRTRRPERLLALVATEEALVINYTLEHCALPRACMERCWT